MTTRLTFLLIASFVFSCASHAAQPNGKSIEDLTHLKGKMDAAEGVFKVSLARDDIKPQSNGVKITPPLGLTAWAAFMRAGDGDMVMGDLVLTEDQVNPVLDAALANGLEVTALHNHFLWDQPRVMFMHIGGHDSEAKLAKAVGEVFAKLRETQKHSAPSKIDPPTGKLNGAKLTEILGQPGELTAGVYKVVVGRKTKMHGEEVGKAMGVNTWAAFAGTDKEAVVDGDFAMLEDELQPVLKALRAANIQVVAIHNHMTMESPRIVFLHYWGLGPAEQLAQGVRNALNTQKF